MAKASRPRPDTIVTVAWLKQQFDQIRRDDALILKRLDELSKQSSKETALILTKIEEFGTDPRLEFEVGPVTTKTNKKETSC